MTTKRTRVLIVTISVLSVFTALGIIFRGTEKSYGDDVTKDAAVSSLIRNVSNELDRNKSRQGLIEAFCTATAEAAGFADPDAQGMYYEAQQSLFLSLLCQEHKGNRAKTKQYVRSFEWENLNIPGCEWDDNMTTCDFSVFLPKLFSIVMNDLSKAKLAQLYGYQTVSTDEAIKAFSDTYFGPGETICGSKSAVYLGKSEGSEKEAPCMHPQTRTTLAQYITQAKAFADQTVYIDTKNLLTTNTDTCEKDPKNFLICAFDTTNAYNRDAFHNLLYNELLYYSILVTLAADRIQYPEYNDFRALSDTREEAREEIIRLVQEKTLTEEAVMYTEKTLQNMQAAFPIHIGLLAYYEDIIAFRKSLIRIYTPLHQLNYKLRNVQANQ